MRILILVFLTNFAFSAHAADTDVEQIYNDLTNQYADVVALLDLCGLGPGKEALETEAELGAKWLEPSFMSWISGDRASKQKLILSRMNLY